ncbi:hypothetical protein ADK57_34730 [Streptomyces sp. MMG1533]|nr:hypothetical protein ADK57_34730 [Streptomyces sp. MMG1533]
MTSAAQPKATAANTKDRTTRGRTTRGIGPLVYPATLSGMETISSQAAQGGITRPRSRATPSRMAPTTWAATK